MSILNQGRFNNLFVTIKELPVVRTRRKNFVKNEKKMTTIGRIHVAADKRGLRNAPVEWWKSRAWCCLIFKFSKSEDRRDVFESRGIS